MCQKGAPEIASVDLKGLAGVRRCALIRESNRAKDPIRYIEIVTAEEQKE